MIGMLGWVAVIAPDSGPFSGESTIGSVAILTRIELHSFITKRQHRVRDSTTRYAWNRQSETSTSSGLTPRL